MTDPKRILVIMLRRIGDVVLTTPAVRALRGLFPAAQIDFLVAPPAHELLWGIPELSNILVYNADGIFATLAWLGRIRSRRYDWVIDYMGTPRTAMLTFASGSATRAGPAHVWHRWAYNRPLRQSDEAAYSAIEKIRVLRSLGLSPGEDDPLPRLSADSDSEDFAHSALNRLRIPRGSIVGFAPASRRATRQWPEKSFAELGRRLRDEEGASVIVFWGPGERELAERVRDGIGPGAYLAPETKGLRQLAALIGRCRILVTNCNGPKHIAVARGVPTLTIHGSSDPKCWNPPEQPLHPALRLEELHCIGCRLNACPYGLECMLQLTPARVLEAAKGLLLRSAA